MRLYTLNLSGTGNSERCKKLYADYNPLLEREEVKAFTAAVQQYQKNVGGHCRFYKRKCR
jgi:hypothetical protein